MEDRRTGCRCQRLGNVLPRGAAGRRPCASPRGVCRTRYSRLPRDQTSSRLRARDRPLLLRTLRPRVRRDGGGRRYALRADGGHGGMPAALCVAEGERLAHLMLGSHDFCGHYEWTFHYVRRRFGQQAVRSLWADAIGGESQDHYAKAALRAGLRGLYETWIRTGNEEQCNWTFTLDEEKNVLRWDMYQCPSKGFLLNNDLNADED